MSTVLTLSAEEQRSSVPSGWTPIDLLSHVLAECARHAGQLDVALEVRP